MRRFRRQEFRNRQPAALSSATFTEAAPRALAADRPIALWLLLCCAMIFAMVVIGGITRLTESGLSITEWHPVTGVLPPRDAGEWQAEFEKYKAIPQYRAIHADMTLQDFKFIFFWEYLHRLWGRLIGVAFAAPFLYFLLRGRIPWRLAPRLAGLFVLGGLQGALGWYMVKSGLAERVEVSQYRLAAHLIAAVIIYIAILWVALDLLAPKIGPLRDPRLRRLRRGAAVVLLLALTTMAAGAFVAGLRAGAIYNTFPLMGGAWVPGEYGALTPWTRNWFENPAAAQFDHRLLAEITWLAVVLLWASGRRAVIGGARWALDLLLLATSLQAALGIATLLLVVPLSLAASHQAGAMLLVTAAVAALHALGRAPRLDAPSARAL